MLNVARGEVIYFDGNRVRMVDVETLEDELLFLIPDNREPIGQNCATPDGQWLVYIVAPKGSSRRGPCEGAKVVAYNFDADHHRVLSTIDVAIHHVTRTMRRPSLHRPLRPHHRPWQHGQRVEQHAGGVHSGRVAVRQVSCPCLTIPLEMTSPFGR